MNISPTQNGGRTRVLALSSGGGHWVQLLRLRPAFEKCDVTYVTVNKTFRADLEPGARFRTVPDSNMWHKGRLLITALCVLWTVLCVRPHVVISTGAAPGFFAVLFGRLLGARTIWVDSIANAEKLSMSGQQAGKRADLWLTQWPHLQGENGPYYFGSVL